jgi:hypothetical protein
MEAILTVPDGKRLARPSVSADFVFVKSTGNVVFY